MNRRRFVSSVMASDTESPANNPGLRSDSPDEETKGYIMQQTVIDLIYFNLFIELIWILKCVK